MKNLYLIIIILINYQAFSQGFQWVNTMGGNDADEGNQILVSSNGDVLSVGTFSSQFDADPGPGVSNLIPGTYKSPFFIKYSSLGNFIWAKSLGNLGGSVSIGTVNKDLNDDYFITGTFIGVIDFDMGNSTYTLNSGSYYNFFLLKLNASGNFQWVKSAGNYYGTDPVKSIIDNSGNIILTGVFYDTLDVNLGTGTTEIYSPNSYNRFFAKYNTNGDLLWVKHTKGNLGYTSVNSIVVDNSNSLFIGGLFNNIFDFETGVNTYTVQSAGGDDAFIWKIDSNGVFNWVNSFGNSNDGRTLDIKVNSFGDVFALGNFSGIIDLDIGPNVFLSNSTSNFALFISKFNSNGNFLTACTFSQSSIVNAKLIIDDFDNLAVSGSFIGYEDFDPGVGNSNTNSNGSTDIFILKLDQNLNFKWYRQLGSPDEERVFSIEKTNNSDLLLTGIFSNSLDFDPDSSSVIKNSNGSKDAFLLKLKLYDVSIPKNSLLKKINIFPNPTSKFINIEFDNELDKVELFDLTGRKIFENSKLKNKIDVSYFENGIYFLKITTSNQSITNKVIIKK